VPILLANSLVVLGQLTIGPGEKRWVGGGESGRKWVAGRTMDTRRRATCTQSALWVKTARQGNSKQKGNKLVVATFSIVSRLEDTPGI